MTAGRVVNISLKSHIFGGGGRDRCWCGVYHYICADCGADCTMGTSAGPATTDTRNVTRCQECNGEWERLRHTMSPWSREEIAAIKVALSQISDDGDPDPITPENRKVATQILSRAENLA